jgi:hypothetical protein
MDEARKIVRPTTYHPCVETSYRLMCVRCLSSPYADVLSTELSTEAIPRFFVLILLQLTRS